MLKISLRRTICFEYNCAFVQEKISFGAVAQLGERKAGSLEVRGSIPLSSTSKIKGVNSIGLTPFFES